MGKWRASEAELVWKGPAPSGAVIEKVRTDIDESLTDLAKASDLAFHTVFLGDDYETCPVVMVWGEKRDKRLHCEYVAETEWVSLADIEEPFS
jgi:hypothetical protein